MTKKNSLGKTTVDNNPQPNSSGKKQQDGVVNDDHHSAAAAALILSHLKPPPIPIGTSIKCSSNNDNNNTEILLLQPQDFRGREGGSAAAVAVLMTLSCVLLFLIHGIPFLTLTDVIHFWCSVGCVCLLSVLSWVQWQNDTSLGSEACIYALCVLADAIYRSPENPYAAIFCVIFAINQWQKILVLCVFSGSVSLQSSFSPPPEMHDDDDDQCDDTRNRRVTTFSTTTIIMMRTITKIIDLILTTLFMCLSIQTGLVPQFTEAEDWPIYGGVGAFVTFATAWYKTRLNFFLYVISPTMNASAVKHE